MRHDREVSPLLLKTDLDEMVRKLSRRFLIMLLTFSALLIAIIWFIKSNHS